MDLLLSSTNRFGGVVIDPNGLPADVDGFQQRLQHSLDAWTEEGLKVVWLEVPIGRSALISPAVEAGFSFHHSGQDYLMLTRQL